MFSSDRHCADFTPKVDTPTQRGFMTYLEFTDLYGAEIVVRQSSLATQDALWIFTNRGEVNTNKGSVHMCREMAVAVRDALDRWLEDAQHFTPEPIEGDSDADG